MAPDSNTKTQSLLMRSDLAKLGVPPQEVLRWLREGWVECLGELAPGDTPGDGDVVLGVTDPKLRDRLTADLALIGKGDAILAPARARAAMLRVLIDRHERVEEPVPPAPAHAAPVAARAPDLAADAERLEHTAAEMLIETLGPAVDETLHDEAMDLLGDLEAHADQARRDEAATGEPSAREVEADVPAASSSVDDADWEADSAFEGFDADALMDLTAAWDEVPCAVDEVADEPDVDAAPPAASDAADEPAIVDEVPTALVEQTAEVPAPANPDAAEASVEVGPIESTEFTAVDTAQVAEIAEAAAPEPIENAPAIADETVSTVTPAPTFEDNLDGVIDPTIDAAPAAAAPVTATEPGFTEELATIDETPDAIVAHGVEDPAPAPPQDATEADVTLDASAAAVAPSSEPDFAPADRLEDAPTATAPEPTPTPAPSFEPALAALRRELAATQHGQQRIEQALTQLGTEMGDLGASLQKTLALAASTDGGPRLVLRPRRSVPGSILVAGAIALWSVVLWVKTGNGRLALLGIAAANIVFCGLHWARRR